MAEPTTTTRAISIERGEWLDVALLLALAAAPIVHGFAPISVVSFDAPGRADALARTAGNPETRKR